MKISNDFDVARKAFFKVIVRFSYTTQLTMPRNDAPKTVILQHITQLAPILHKHVDVILAVQHGFIGTWGEGYYTDHFGDQGTISQEQQEDRQEVYNALMNSVPECTMIQVRTWVFKERLTGTDQPVSIDIAFSCGNSTSAVARNARTGIHDDCFLASETDFGTWVNSAQDRPRISEQTVYSVFGGETCNPSSSRNACPVALHDLSYFHFTYLNNRYHPSVLQRWKNESCYETVTQKLGYRLLLVSSRFPKNLFHGEEMTFEVTVRNDGFAAPVTEHLLQLILVQGGRNLTLTMNGTHTDPRFWLANGTETTLNGTVLIPSDEQYNGTWSMYMAIVDAAPSLQSVPQYNILTVNQLVTAQGTGLNDLRRSVTITTQQLLPSTNSIKTPVATSTLVTTAASSITSFSATPTSTTRSASCRHQVAVIALATDLIFSLSLFLFYI